MKKASNQARNRLKWPKLEPKQTIILLAKLLAKDVNEAELSPRLQKKIIGELCKLLSQVDANLKGVACHCVVDGVDYGNILRFNCIWILGGNCV
jgi:hypothetical protein